MDKKKLIIGGVIVAVAIGGYLYWKNTQKAAPKKKKLSDSPQFRKRVMRKAAPALQRLRDSGKIPTQQ